MAKSSVKTYVSNTPSDFEELVQKKLQFWRKSELIGTKLLQHKKVGIMQRGHSHGDDDFVSDNEDRSRPNTRGSSGTRKKLRPDYEAKGKEKLIYSSDGDDESYSEGQKEQEFRTDDDD
ncbi:E3 ubiquitin protein ligase 2 [Striga asiatica]|uniref:E3 ubiquitin protein ligase 2 n=1 Tax=Striga asiatica TaxID=4170 RepID=A0A5A7Q2L4_STRAF|nr:E3 ubiquitin protein ligase 2 [Striga asiatica]